VTPGLDTPFAIWLLLVTAGGQPDYNYSGPVLVNSLREAFGRNLPVEKLLASVEDMSETGVAEMIATLPARELLARKGGRSGS
jgi:hypothetical protein